MGKWLLLGIIILLLPATVAAAPSAYITENVRASFNTDGTIDGPVLRSGSVEVSVSNTVDVLQYIVIELSSISGTNIQSNITFRSVISSPVNPGDRTPMFINTTIDPQDISYQILNASATPVINTSLDYSNGGTGREINGTSLFLFNVNLTPDSFINLPNSRLIFEIALDTLGINDSMNLSGLSSTSGLTNLLDVDLDGFYDHVVWAGDLTPGSSVIVSFTGLVIPNLNYDSPSFASVNISNPQTAASHTADNTFTGIDIHDRLSRGPIREGVELIDRGGTWLTRGFIRNVANSLQYIIRGWDLYRVSDVNFQSLISNNDTSYVLNPGEANYTGWYTSVSSEKQFYAAGFDWEVIWGASDPTGNTVSRLNMPMLYEIDSWIDKTVSIFSNTAAGRTLEVTDTARHLGHSSVGVEGAYINSSFSHLSITAGPAAWSPSDISVLFLNSSGNTTDITSFATITQLAATASDDGFVFVNVTNLTGTIGRSMLQNEDLILRYRITAASHPANLNFSFNTMTTLWTASGTPKTRSLVSYLVIPGIPTGDGPPSGGGGGGGGGSQPPPSLYADIVKTDSQLYFVESDLVNITVVDDIIDTGDKGVRDIKLFLFVPEGGEVDKSRVSIRIFNNSKGYWSTWKRNQDYTITEQGITHIGETLFREYLIEKKTTDEPYETTFDLHNGDKLEINYIAKIPFGTSFILTRTSGLNYYEDKIIFEDVYNPVRREGELEPFEIEVSEWLQRSVVVDRLSRFEKIYTLFNPNNVSVENIVTTEVFGDTMSTYLNTSSGITQLELIKENVTFVEWSVKLGPGETGIYYVEAITPPVIEVDRKTEIINYNETSATFAVNSTLTNFAEENYTNVSFIFNVKKKNIRSISDFINNLFEHENGTEIIIPFIAANETLKISLIYIETPPVLITFLDKDEYDRNESAQLTIFVIPSENEPNPYLNVEVFGPDEDLRTVFADIVEIGITGGEGVEFNKTLNLGSLPSGKYIIYTKFRQDFGDVLSDRVEFSVREPTLDFVIFSYIIVIVIAILIVGYVVIKRPKRRTYKREMTELEKEIERL